MRMIALGLGLVVASALGFLIAGDSIRGVTSTQDHPTVDVPTRWGQTSVGPVPADSGLRVRRQSARREVEHDTFEVYLDGEGVEPPDLIIHATTGVVESDTLSEKHASLAEIVKQTIKIALPEPTVWPYSDMGAPKSQSTFGGVTYLLPRPDSGIEVVLARGFCATQPCSPHAMSVLTDRSYLHVDADLGLVHSSDIDSADSAAFERFMASLVVVPATAPAGDQ